MKHVSKEQSMRLRLLLILALFFVAYLIIAVRLFVIQVKDAHFFEILAAEQYGAAVVITPPRACIYDSTHKVPLAFNQEVLSAFITPHNLLEKDKTLAFLHTHFPHVYASYNEKPNRKFVWVKRGLLAEEQDLICSSSIKDIYFIPEYKRCYPFSEMAPLVGTTDIDNKGIEGLECAFDKQLRGEPSEIFVERDGRRAHFHFAHAIKKVGAKGKSLTTTLDSTLQTLASTQLKKTIEKFEAQEGCVLIVDPCSGHILAMAQYPSSASHSLEGGARTEPLKNGVVANCYEFGSVIKTFAALAALEERVTTTDEIIDCEGKVAFVDRVRVENPKYVEQITFSDVVKFSSNVGIAKISKRLGPKIYDHFIRLGFGAPTGLEFPGERSGFVAHPKNWSRSSPIVLSFGYELNGTIMQLGKAFSILANNGFEVKPTLIKHKGAQQLKKRLYEEENIERIKAMLDTTFSAKKWDGFRILGKTGTARIAQNGTYSTTRHLYSFGGIIEKGEYKRVIITFIKEPKKAHLWASEVAKPLFESIAEKMVIHDRLEGKQI